MEKARVYWFFGLSGSGKSTVADAFALRLNDFGQHVFRLDGDELRKGVNKDLGFSQEDRMENVRRAAEMAQLALTQGFTVVASFISPEEIHREKVRSVLGEYVEMIFVDASIDTCRTRDVKGLYQQVEKGNIKEFTGVSAPFEMPNMEELRISTDGTTVEHCVNVLWEKLIVSRK